LRIREENGSAGRKLLSVFTGNYFRNEADAAASITHLHAALLETVKMCS